MKKLALIAVAASGLILTGCVAQSVPRLNLKVNMKTGEVGLSNPKDTTITNYKTTINSNGTVSVSFDSLTTVMNPNVITTTGDAQAKMIDSVGNAVTSAVKAGVALKP